MNIQLKHYSKDQLRMTEAANPASIKMMPSGVIYFYMKFLKYSGLKVGDHILFSHDAVNNKWYVSKNEELGLEIKSYNNNYGSGLCATICSTLLRHDILVSNNIDPKSPYIYYMSCSDKPSLMNIGKYFHEVKILNA